MGERSKAKKFLLVGAITGGFMSLTISLLMDSIYADTLNGTWRDAIAKDLNTLLPSRYVIGKRHCQHRLPFVLAILAAFGAFMGIIFSFFLYKFFGFLTSK